MKFWCRQCQADAGVTTVVWRVNAMGRASPGGQCEGCRDGVCSAAPVRLILQRVKLTHGSQPAHFAAALDTGPRWRQQG